MAQNMNHVNLRSWCWK